MINQSINLYQARFKEARPVMSASHGLIVLGLTLLIIAASSVWYQQLFNERQQAHETRLQQKEKISQQLLVVKAKLDKLLADDSIRLQLQKVKKDVAVRKRMIEFVSRNQLGTGPGFADPLGELSELKVQDVWLSRISLAENFISLSGSALKAEDVPRYFERLQERALFENKVFEVFEVDRNEPDDWKVDFFIASRVTAGD